MGDGVGGGWSDSGCVCGQRTVRDNTVFLGDSDSRHVRLAGNCLLSPPIVWPTLVSFFFILHNTSDSGYIMLSVGSLRG